ncbi:membrane bound O-acyl transferase family-domain-containing protein [Xylariomycetidae sp. FL2044]|nr:membrane bound O-acyl transferase family-domain-containing protein [Xylariomycetidae sp. FL2044]
MVSVCQQLQDNQYSMSLTYLKTLYPPVEDRLPIPPLYTQASFVLAVLAVLGLAMGRRGHSPFIVYSCLVLWTLLRPCYTSDSPSGDYNTAGIAIIFIINIWDHTRAPAQVYRIGASSDRSKAVPAPPSWREDLSWAVNLVTSLRGVGWNWQVKGVPKHPAPNQSRLGFVATSAGAALKYRLLFVAAVYGLGFCRAMKAEAATSAQRHVLDVIIAWCGGCWAWNGIAWVHAVIAGITVAMGVCEPSQWPPILGSLTDAWSVRQMWGVSYHQLLRRSTQQPGIQLSRALGFGKGTFGSRYIQLYLAFAISCAIHVWQQFSISRQDRGEIAFFLLQPVVITFEDFVQWAWHKAVAPKQRKSLAGFERAAGYMWTFVAFSWTLRPFVNSLADVGIIGESMDQRAALLSGQNAALRFRLYWT